MGPQPADGQDAHRVLLERAYAPFPGVSRRVAAVRDDVAAQGAHSLARCTSGGCHRVSRDGRQRRHDEGRRREDTQRRRRQNGQRSAEPQAMRPVGRARAGASVKGAFGEPAGAQQSPIINRGGTRYRFCTSPRRQPARGLFSGAATTASKWPPHAIGRQDPHRIP